jgi:hypothetical protein
MAFSIVDELVEFLEKLLSAFVKFRGFGEAGDE